MCGEATLNPTLPTQVVDMVTKAQLKQHRAESIHHYQRAGSKTIVIHTTIGVCQKCGGEISLYDDYHKKNWGQFDVICPNPDCQQEYFLSPIV